MWWLVTGVLVNESKLKKAVDILGLLTDVVRALTKAIAQKDERSVDEILASPLRTQLSWVRAQLRRHLKYKVTPKEP